MMYTLDVSGRRDDGSPSINRFGGLFKTVGDALSRGQMEAEQTSRLWFKPEVIWVRDEEGEVARIKLLA